MTDTDNKKQGAKALAEGRSDLLRVKPSNLNIDPEFNVRVRDEDYEAHILWLMESIKAEGVKEPVKAYFKGEKLWVTNGHSRLEAVNRLAREGIEIKTIPVMLEDRHASDAEHTLTLITSNSGRPLKALEAGLVYKRLTNYGWQIPEIAKRAAVTVQTVERALELNAAPEEIKELVRDKKVSATVAVNEMRTAQRAGSSKQEAAATLQKAVAKATAQGKSKATPKQVSKAKGKAGLTPIKALNLVRDELHSAAVEDDKIIKGKKVVVVTFELEGWDAIKKAVDYDGL
jgi:DNA-binding transcriptional regulator YhcF (GntR family)